MQYIGERTVRTNNYKLLLLFLDRVQLACLVIYSENNARFKCDFYIIIETGNNGICF